MQFLTRLACVVVAASVWAAAGCTGSSSVLGRGPAPFMLPSREPQPTPRSLPPPPPRVSTPPVVAAKPPPVVNKSATPAGWIPPSGIENRWDYIVVHHSATSKGGAAAFDRHHRVDNGWDELGYHFVIGNGTDTRDGQIEVGSRWTKQKTGAHCKAPGNYYNEHGIGICLVGNFQSRGPSPAQMASLARLTKFLMEECDIPTNHVVGHGGVTGKTACPGKMFPLASLRTQVGGVASASSHR